MLAYRTPWEFVAERFHCSESYLRTLNDKLPPIPGSGTEFRVPNVIPFEIEKAFDEPLQPQADPQNPVTAAVIGLSQLNIYRGGALVAVMPMSPARPGLRGRGSWTILDAIPRPRLATFQEEWKEQTRKTGPLYGSATPQPTPSPFKPKPSSEQYLAAGPRNPAGILWINLAKVRQQGPVALRSARHKHSGPNEHAGKYRRVETDKLGHCARCASAAIRYADRVEAAINYPSLSRSRRISARLARRTCSVRTVSVDRPLAWALGCFFDGGREFRVVLRANLANHR